MTRTLRAGCALDARASLAEGPVWDPGREVLWWVDILGHRVHRFDPAADEDRAFEAWGPAGAVALRADGSLLVAAGRELSVLDPESGAFRPLGAALRLADGLRFNDGKCDPEGRLWIGTMDLDAAPGRGALHCVHPDGTVERKLDGLTIPNGLAWSADAATMYFIDSPAGAVWAMEYDRESGAIGERRDAVRIESPAAPDGMTIDEEGMLWVAEWGVGSVSCFDPSTGERLARVELPVEQATSCTFGGPALAELYVTTGRERFTPEDAERQPLAGGLFHVRPGVRGLAPARFGG